MLIGTVKIPAETEEFGQKTSDLLIHRLPPQQILARTDRSGKVTAVKTGFCLCHANGILLLLPIQPVGLTKAMSVCSRMEEINWSNRNCGLR